MKAKPDRFKEVWSAELRGKDGEIKTIHVFANSAAQAEKKALVIERRRSKANRMLSPVCYQTKFEMNVEE